MKSYRSIALICSTGGSVISRVADYDPNFRAAVSLVVSDRSCGAEAIAEKLSVPLVRLEERDGEAFSDHLLNLLTEYGIDYACLFFTRMLHGRLLETFASRLINFHPSLLPANPGLHGFEDTLASGALLYGSTVHFADTGMDSGPVIQQTFAPLTPDSIRGQELRHRLFHQQCASLSQVVSWALEGRLIRTAGRRVVIPDARYDAIDGFIPALESDISRQLASLQPAE